ncbi:MAG: riboflavin synthase [Bryobacteraceae bacterium]|nr:riboflavin synthase [Bryobacteraceae bacterium]
MFTGIIEEVGVVEALEKRSTGARLRVRCRKVLEDVFEGASIAVNGVCLTAVEPRPDLLTADIAPETLSRTNLGALRRGSLVNLERPLSPSGRLSGHMVQGHVDDTGELNSLRPLGGGNWWLEVRVPHELEPYLAPKGSVAIDGISLTIASLEQGMLGVAIIPHTYENTNLKSRKPGERLNLECDILAKYVERLLRQRGTEPLTMDRMRELGY